jgi:hypothetical protein
MDHHRLHRVMPGIGIQLPVCAICFAKTGFYCGDAGGCGKFFSHSQPATVSNAMAASPTLPSPFRYRRLMRMLLSIRPQQGRLFFRLLQLQQLRPVITNLADLFAHRPRPQHVLGQRP